MNTRKATAEYRMAQWAQIIQTRVERGQNIRDFCAAEGISRNAYFYWQKKLREAACTELARRETKAHADIGGGGWTQIEQRKAQDEESAISIDVCGYRIAVRAGTDLDLLAAVCRTLKTLC
jgi:putative transposase